MISASCNCSCNGIEVSITFPVNNPSSVIFAFDENISITMKTQTDNPLQIFENEKQMLKKLLEDQEITLFEPVIGGVPRVATGFYFEPFEWYYLVTVEKNTFYQDVNQITNWSLIILGISLVFSLLLLLFFPDKSSPRRL